MSQLKNKTAVVTGASRGIGREIAKRLAAAGAFVVAHYNRSAEEAETLLREIRDSGGEGVAVRADLSRPDEVADFARDLGARLQAERGAETIDILVNNAAVAVYNSFAETTAEEFDLLYNVNVKSLFFLTQSLLPKINDGGRIVNISSVVSRAYFPGILAYSTTKGAIDVLTTHLAAELGARGITVNSVAPGAIETDMSAWLGTDEGVETAHSIQSIKRVGRAADVARVVAFLASDESGWVTGQTIEASGGTKL